MAKSAPMLTPIAVVVAVDIVSQVPVHPITPSPTPTAMPSGVSTSRAAATERNVRIDSSAMMQVTCTRLRTFSATMTALSAACAPSDPPATLTRHRQSPETLRSGDSDPGEETLRERGLIGVAEAGDHRPPPVGIDQPREVVAAGERRQQQVLRHQRAPGRYGVLPRLFGRERRMHRP